jgi:hypothetical protein
MVRLGVIRNFHTDALNSLQVKLHLGWLWPMLRKGRQEARTASQNPSGTYQSHKLLFEHGCLSYSAAFQLAAGSFPHIELYIIQLVEEFFRL